MILPAKPIASVISAAAKKGKRTTSNLPRFPSKTATLLVIIVVCGLPSSVYPVPLPSSSAWSLPTLNYLFKDTKTRSQSTNSVTGHGSHEAQHHLSSSPLREKSALGGDHNHDSGTNGIGESNPTLSTDGKAASTGRLISSHDIRLTDNWGWVRRGVSDPAQTTETRRKQSRNNIRHSKSKHKQRHSASPSSPSSASTSSFHSSSMNTSSSRAKKKEHLLCPFDEIRGPDGKCRKAPRFSLYRVGRK